MIAHNRLRLEDVIEFIESQNCEYIEGEYKGVSSELFIKYRCGHSDWVQYSVFQNAKTFLCRKCQKRSAGDKFKKPIDTIIYDLQSYGLEFMCFDPEYINNKSKIRYKCSNNHIVSVQINTFYNNPGCSECHKIKQYNDRKGSGHPLWNGGTSYLSPLVKGNMLEWRKQSIENSGCRCIITGDYFNAVHHLYAFNMILDEALSNLNLLNKKVCSEYTEDEIIEIIEECKRLHEIYPLGVCLRKDVHILFHQLYGMRNNTPDQFYDFADKVYSGEIIIPN